MEQPTDAQRRLIIERRNLLALWANGEYQLSLTKTPARSCLL